MPASSFTHLRAGPASPDPPPAPPFQGGESGLRDLLLVEELLELAGLVHLHHDVGAADELALDVELGHGRPVGIVLHALADLRILEDVDGLEADPEMVEDGD